VSSTVLERLERILEEGGDVDDVLRATVEALAAEAEIAWAGVRFLEDGELVLGPSAGAPDEPARSAIAIAFHGDRVGELVVDGHADHATLARVADLIAPYVLLGWDTGGEAWKP
jgi:hypothetical protein